MASIICHHKGRYNIYSTVSDRFKFDSSMNLQELKEYIKEELGRKGLEKLPRRLKKVHKRGHSGFPPDSLTDTLCCNRAGENETTLTTQECIERFLS